MKEKEIERQWVAGKGDDFHELEDLAATEIEQFYVKVTGDEEIRYRKKRVAGCPGWSCTMTRKKGTGLTRDEEIVSIPVEEYDGALDHDRIKESSVIKKKRVTWKINGFRYDVNQFIDPESDKIVVEVEFDNEENARGFELLPDVVPRYFKDPVEVTEDERWKLKNVALHGFPALN